MKRESSFTVRLLILLALTFVFTLTFIACSDNEGDEPTIDELLSEETTPIDFEFDDFEYIN